MSHQKGKGSKTISRLFSALLSSQVAFVGISITILFSMQAGMAQAKSNEQLADIAKSITVRIDGASTSASGVLIKREGNRYTVLTAWHVLASQNPGEELYVSTHDGHSHQALYFKKISNLDLAEVEFESLSSYKIVAPGNVDEPGVPISIYGYPSASKPEFQTGSILPPSKKNCVSRTPFLFHNAVTSIGMSGSPILNSKGLLVAIHLGGNPESTHRSSQSYQQGKTGVNSALHVSGYFKHIKLPPALQCRYATTDLAEELRNCSGKNFYCGNRNSISTNAAQQIRLDKGYFDFIELVRADDVKCTGVKQAVVSTMVELAIFPLFIKNSLNRPNNNCSLRTTKIRLYKEKSSNYCGMIVNRFGPDFWVKYEGLSQNSWGAQLSRLLDNNRAFMKGEVVSSVLKVDGYRFQFELPSLVDSSNLVGFTNQRFKVYLKDPENRGTYAEALTRQDGASQNLTLFKSRFQKQDSTNKLYLGIKLANKVRVVEHELTRQEANSMGFLQNCSFAT